MRRKQIFFVITAGACVLLYFLTHRETIKSDTGMTMQITSSSDVGTKANFTAEGVGLSQSEFNVLTALQPQWSPAFFEKFKRARKALPRQDFSDFFVMTQMEYDTDDPKIIAGILKARKTLAGLSHYAVPKNEAEAYALTRNSPLAYIMAAFACGEGGRSVLNADLLEAGSALFPTAAELTYANLMANKSYLHDEVSIARLREAWPDSSVPDLMTAAALLKAGNPEESYKYFKAASEKSFGTLSLMLENEEINYRVSHGESLADALHGGTRIDNVTGQSLLAASVGTLTVEAYNRFKADPKSDWATPAAYALRLYEVQQDQMSISDQDQSLSSQLSMIKLLGKGQWGEYFKEDYETVQQNITQDYEEAKKSKKLRDELLSTGTPEELQQFVNSRVKIGEVKALQEVLNAREQPTKQ